MIGKSQQAMALNRLANDTNYWNLPTNRCFCN